MSSRRTESKKEIRNYDHFRKMVDDGEMNNRRGGSLTAIQIDQRYDVGWLQLLAWMARYSKEHEDG